MCQSKGLCVSTKLVLEVAKEKAIELGRDLKCSNGWFEKFKKRTNLRLGKIHGESKCVDKRKVDEWKCEVIPRLVLEWQSEFIYNCDETGLFWRQIPNRTYFFSKHEHGGDKIFNERVSILFCVNMKGDKEIPLVIGRSKKPRCSYGGWLDDVNVIYRSQENSWMNTSLFDEWLTNWNQRLINQGKKILLLLDNFSGHKVDFSKFENITFKFLPSNTTSFTQPLDSGIIHSFKAKYLNLMIKRFISEINMGKLSEIMKNLTLLDALNWIDIAWKEITSQTVTNCWSHSGYVNLDITPEMIHDYEIELENTLNEFANVSSGSCSSKDLLSQVTFDYENFFD
ncbi:tigger transposable element-derived protein 6-like [Panonychus citri]|uniref:tigger transposable element-derived protein 6-like n=1 Tax=Panonychus citri TaxID=50023 RepID=UPI002307BB93|nr:tigger transposable element-derived protein 6-like [Panonychus citri]